MTTTPKPGSIDMSQFKAAGRNVKVCMIEGTLFLAIDTKAPGKVSGSGKSNVIASTEGNVTVPDTAFKLGLNFYQPNA